MKKNIAIPIGITTGLTSAIAVQVLFTFTDYLNSLFHWGLALATIRGSIGLLSMVILGVGIFTGMHKTRAEEGSDFTWRRALWVGITISLLTALIAAIGALVFNLINPGFDERMAADAVSSISSQTKTAEELKEYGQHVRQESSTFMMVVQALIGQLLGGTIISLVLSIFMRGQRGK